MAEEIATGAIVMAIILAVGFGLFRASGGAGVLLFLGAWAVAVFIIAKSR